MANVKDLKKKIKATKGTLKITQAMKLVSASKFARAGQILSSARPYASELELTIKTISALCEEYDHPYLKETDNPNAALLVISANKGLCGGYNSQLAKAVQSFFSSGNHSIQTFFIGKKVRDVVDRGKKGKLYHFDKNEPSLKEMEKVGKELSDLFCAGGVGKVFVAYNRFHSAMSFTPTVVQLLPLEGKAQLVEEYPFDFQYDCPAADILDSLIPDSLLNCLRLFVLNAHASEHGSRMTAMDSAVTNCKEAIREQTIKMNKLRQAAITTELIEVVSGAESLN